MLWCFGKTTTKPLLLNNFLRANPKLDLDLDLDLDLGLDLDLELDPDPEFNSNFYTRIF